MLHKLPIGDILLGLLRLLLHINATKTLACSSHPRQQDKRQREGEREKEDWSCSWGWSYKLPLIIWFASNLTDFSNYFKSFLNLPCGLKKTELLLNQINLQQPVSDVLHSTALTCWFQIWERGFFFFFLPLTGSCSPCRNNTCLRFQRVLFADTVLSTLHC